MIDRENRDRLALAMRRLISGRITNDEFDRVGEELMVLRHTLERCDCGYDMTGLPGGRCPECGRVPDPALSEIACRVWLCYSDLRAHYLRGDDAVGKEERRELARAVLFLKTDFEYRYGWAMKNTTTLGEPGGLWMGLLIVTSGVAGLLLLLGVSQGSIWLVLAGAGVLIAGHGAAWARSRLPSLQWRRRRAMDAGAQGQLSGTVLAELWPFATEEELDAARARRVFFGGS